MLITSSASRKKTLAVAMGIMGGLALLLFFFASSVSPAPPGRIEMTTGSANGAVQQFALQYQSYLKANGVALDLLPSTGSVQNLERLHAGVPVGFVQGGLGTLTRGSGDLESGTPLRSLGVVGYEPIWMFASPALATSLARGLGPLAGKITAIGANGSGTRKVALELLQAYGVSAANATLSPDGLLVAANALLTKNIDALIIVGAPQTPAVELLLSRPDDVRLVSIEHAEGLTRRFPYMSLVVLKAGSIDPAKDRPSRDITLLTTTANLVIREDLHPALAYLLLQAARDIHRGGTLLNRPGEFPNGRATDFPLADEATRYYRDGKPFLQRYMPYWAANAMQRLLVVLVPLLAISIPLFRIVPTLLEFRQKRRLYRRYTALLGIEHDIAARKLSEPEIAEAITKLDEIEHEASHMKIALHFSDRVYTLRQHVDYVRRQLLSEKNRLGEKPTTTDAAV